MDKKVLVDIVNKIVSQVAEANGLDDCEARALVGLTLKKNTEGIASACRLGTIVIPKAE